MMELLVGAVLFGCLLSALIGFGFMWGYHKAMTRCLRDLEKLHANTMSLVQEINETAEKGTPL